MRFCLRSVQPQLKDRIYLNQLLRWTTKKATMKSGCLMVSVIVRDTVP